jgi:hypothetical protein
MLRACDFLLSADTHTDMDGVAMGNHRAGGHVHRDFVGTDIYSIVYWVECRLNFRRDKIMSVAVSQIHKRPCMGPACAMDTLFASAAIVGTAAQDRDNGRADLFDSCTCPMASLAILLGVEMVMQRTTS